MTRSLGMGVTITVVISKARVTAEMFDTRSGKRRLIEHGIPHSKTDAAG